MASEVIVFGAARLGQIAAISTTTLPLQINISAMGSGSLNAAPSVNGTCVAICWPLMINVMQSSAGTKLHGKRVQKISAAEHHSQRATDQHQAQTAHGKTGAAVQFAAGGVVGSNLIVMKAVIPFIRHLPTVD